MEGSVAELNAQNGIASTVAEHIAVVEQLGGLDSIGGPKMDNMYHSAWAWAGDSPFRYTKLVAADWGGTRTPMVISWPKRIKPDKHAAISVPARQRRGADPLRHSRHHATESRRRPRAGST